MNAIVDASRINRDGMALQFCNYAALLALARGDAMQAAATFENRHPHSRALEMVRKTAVSPGSTTDSAWGAPLSPLAPLGEAFVSYLRPLTIIGRMAGFRAMPFNVRAPRATSGSAVGWIGQGRPMLVSNMNFESMTFKTSKIGGIVVLTKELALTGDPDATQLIREDLSAAVAQFSDQSFLDPALAEVDDVSPASITYGAPSVQSIGKTAVAFHIDFKALCALVTTNMTSPYLVMKPTTAIALATLGDSSNLLRNISAVGGDVAGIPVIVSANTPSDANSPGDELIILVDAAEVFMNEGGIELDASENAVLEMSSMPDSPPTPSTVLRSMFQENLIALLVKRYIRWQPRRSGAVAVLTGVNYGE
jgi:hypothetical protein